MTARAQSRHRNPILFIGWVLLAIGAQLVLSTQLSMAQEPFPTVGNLSVIDALIHTNLEVLGGDPTHLFTHQKQHASCTISSIKIGELGRWQFTNVFDSLQADFLDPDLGALWIRLNPNRVSGGTVVSESRTDPVFPAVSNIDLYLRVEALDLELVSRDPVKIQGLITSWPPIDQQYQAISGPVDFFVADDKGEPSGEPIAQIFGSMITVLLSAEVFTDGFESGSMESWSGAIP